MIKRSVLFTAMLLSASVSAWAQTTPAPAPAPAPAMAAPAPAAPDATPMTRDGKPAMKAVRLQCRDMVKTSGVKGPERRQAMADCIVKQRPDMASRIKCQMDPSLQGLDKVAKHAALKACIVKSKG